MKRPVGRQRRQGPPACGGAAVCLPWCLKRTCRERSLPSPCHEGQPFVWCLVIPLRASGCVGQHSKEWISQTRAGRPKYSPVLWCVCDAALAMLAASAGIAWLREA
eukprot:352485-Chlamydomonas_euryale.AAC.3